MPCAGNTNESESCQGEFWYVVLSINHIDLLSQLKEHGVVGICGEHAQVYVILVLLRVGPETSLEVQCHVMVVMQRTLLVKVREFFEHLEPGM